MGAKKWRSVPSQLQAGDLLKGYRIKRLIAEGGMGAVYEAVEVELQRRVAIKVIREDLIGEAGVKSRFMTEAKALAKVNHPNVVQVYGFEECEGRPFIVMEYIEGVPLDEILENLILPPANAISYFKQVLKGLSHLHEAKILHRDIKPSNLVLQKNGNVKIIDLGIAKSMDEFSLNKTQTSTLVGTPQWLAPELFLGTAANPQTDIWSLGATLFTAVMGRHPYFDFHNKPLPKLAEGRLRSTKEQKRVVDEGLRFVLQKACSKDPAKRYRSCQEMYVDLCRLEKRLKHTAMTTEVYFQALPDQPRIYEFLKGEGYSEFSIRWLTLLSAFHGLNQAHQQVEQSDNTIDLGEEVHQVVHFNSDLYQMATQSYRDFRRRNESVISNSTLMIVLISLLVAGGLWGTQWKAEPVAPTSAVNIEAVPQKIKMLEPIEIEVSQKLEKFFVETDKLLEKSPRKKVVEKTVPKKALAVKKIKPTKKRKSSKKKLLKFTANGLANAPNLKWKPVKGAQEYKVQISKQKSFRNMLFEKTVDSPSYRWWRVRPGLVYWRVMAYNKAGQLIKKVPRQTLWTQVPAPKVTGNIRKVTKIENRRDLKSKSKSEVKLRWQSTNRAALYRYEVYKEGGRKALIKRTTSESEAWVSLPTGSYFYRVIALNNQEEAISQASKRAKISVKRKVQLR